MYDPYYCTGRAKKLLKAVGFKKVLHRKRDFYQVNPTRPLGPGMTRTIPAAAARRRSPQPQPAMPPATLSRVLSVSAPQDVAHAQVPPHDVMVSNPPYSADHKTRCTAVFTHTHPQNNPVCCSFPARHARTPVGSMTIGAPSTEEGEG